MDRQELYDKTVHEIYRRMYREATPPADIDEIIRTGEGKKTNFFRGYYLDQDRQDEIVKEVCEEMGLDAYEEKCIYNQVTLGGSPTGNLEVMVKHRKLYK
jgi:hypothetical protein